VLVGEDAICVNQIRLLYPLQGVESIIFTGFIDKK